MKHAACRYCTRFMFVSFLRMIIFVFGSNFVSECFLESNFNWYKMPLSIPLCTAKVLRCCMCNGISWWCCFWRVIFVVYDFSWQALPYKSAYFCCCGQQLLNILVFEMRISYFPSVLLRISFRNTELFFSTMVQSSSWNWTREIEYALFRSGKIVGF